MIPERELNAYFEAFTKALNLAAEGQIADGYTCLLAGWWRAQNAEGKGEPWAHELMKRYQQAMDNYQKQYGTGQGYDAGAV